MLLPATGYDSVPGNLAGALALRDAQGKATRLRIGYFLTGATRGGVRHMSGGSRATFTAMALQPSFALRGGRVVTERGSRHVGVFDIDGRRRRGVSFGTSEAYSLQRAHPALRDVDVYFGWFENASRFMQAGSLLLAGPTRIPGARAALDRLAARLFPSSTDGPADTTTGSLFVAEALERRGDCVARVQLEGINGYVFTGNALAWAAEQVAGGRASGAGALGPVEAFGVDALAAGVRECGIAAPAAAAR
jgi:hypothetical protein